MRGIGPCNATIMLVGEYPTTAEYEKDQLGIGSSGTLLREMLSDAGIDFNTCYFTHALSVRPPKNKKHQIDTDEWINPTKSVKKGREGEVWFNGKWVHPIIPQEAARLLEEVRLVNPIMVICLGAVPLWFLTSCYGIGKWRGSMLFCKDLPAVKVIPTYNHVDVQRVHKWRYPVVQDMYRAKVNSTTRTYTMPAWKKTIAPTFDQVTGLFDLLLLNLEAGPQRLVLDLEIRYNSILCLGICWTKNEAMCIPMFRFDGTMYFTEEQTLRLINTLRYILTHENMRLCNQNILFDLQFLYWEMLIYCKTVYCTMTGGHVILPSIEKALHTQCSLYCDYYVYWKDDGKFWIGKVEISDEQLWDYNCNDCLYTWDLWDEQIKTVEATPSISYPMQFQMRVLNHVHRMMLRGVRVDMELRNQFLQDLYYVINKLTGFINFLAMQTIDIASPKQVAEFFYEVVGIPPIKNKKKKVSCDEEVMKLMAVKYPLLAPICGAITVARSYMIVSGHVASKIDSDYRWRCSYIVPGTKTYRMASRHNAYDTGLNLQNVTKGKPIDIT